jgi:putative peptide zinc metalloprotease protein
MTGAAPAIPLPPLRQDVAILDGPRAADGAPTWTLHDPVRNRYVRLGREAMRLLSHWSLGEGRRLLAAANAASAGGPAVTEADLERLLGVLDRADLLADATPEATRRRVERRARQRPHWLAWLLKNYLFLRLPLLRPDPLLARLLPLAAPLFSRAFFWLTVAAALVGLLMVARQWEAFVHTFVGFLSWQGAAWAALALFGAKVIHELGHALTARRYGCRVPSMGVALLVLWPVLYTDTSDAWRLTSRRARLQIGAAGMGAELALAAWATLAWSFLPDGPVRAACFLLATVTWVMTLAINLNPFLRFDGYYLLSDWLGVQNLQARGFALGRWRLREALFGLGWAPPEPLSPGLTRGLIVYAWATWIWRFFLFLGIALLVYHLVFKVLGLLLMVVELAWFIARPVADEMKAWWGFRQELRPTRNLALTLLALGGLGVLLGVPWQGHVRAPVVMEAAQAVTVYPPAPARVAAVLAAPGEAVAAGAVLYRLESPDLERRLRMADLRLAALQHEIQRSALDPEASGDVGVLTQRLSETLAERHGLRAQRDRLRVTAPMAGVLRDVPVHLSPGRWINEQTALGRVVATDAPVRLTAYVTAEDLGRLSEGAAGRVYPDDPLRPALPVTVAAIETADVAVLNDPWLAGESGGPIPVRRDGRDRPVPVDPIYRVHLTPSNPDALGVPDRKRLGTARLEGARESLLGRAWRTALAVLVRESGF